MIGFSLNSKYLSTVWFKWRPLNSWDIKTSKAIMNLERPTNTTQFLSDRKERSVNYRCILFWIDLGYNWCFMSRFWDWATARLGCRISTYLEADLLFISWDLMLNYFWGMVDQRRELSLKSSRDHCQRFSLLQIFTTLRAGFEPVQILSLGFVELR